MIKEFNIISAHYKSDNFHKSQTLELCTTYISLCKCSKDPLRVGVGDVHGYKHGLHNVLQFFQTLIKIPKREYCSTGWLAVSADLQESNLKTL